MFSIPSGVRTLTPVILPASRVRPSAHAYAEVVGHVEEVAGDHGGFVLFAELRDEVVHVTAFQTWEGGGAEIGADGGERMTVVGGKEVGE
jgi:hypothetical protein